jgi:TatD DNase family protein
MTIIDTHCHLYVEEFVADIDAVIKKAQQIGVQKMYLPAIDSSSHEAMLKLADEYPNVCIPMMGLHPCYVNENYTKELSIVENWLKQKQFVAIGEIGLDFFWDTTYTNQQITAFEQQMQWALDYKLPIVIHTRNSTKETIERVKPFAARGLKGIFHCFGGTVETANQIIEMNFLLGIGGVVTYKKSGLDETLKHIGLEHLVVETDAPYLAPVPHRGKRNESSYLEFIISKLAEIKQVSVESIAAATTANAQKLFSTAGV